MKLSEVTSALEDPTVWDNPKRAQELGKEKRALEGVVLVLDRLSGERDSKQKGGAIAFLTQGRVDRRMLYAQGLAMALVPFLNEEMYFDGGVSG